MTSFVVRNVRIVDPGRGIRTGNVMVDAGQVVAVGDLDDVDAANCSQVEGRGRLLTPGLVDIHTHGIHNFSYENGPDALIQGTRLLPRYGVTTILPTIIPRPDRIWLEQLDQLAHALDSVEGVNVPGFHLEGPFMAITGASCPKLHGDTALLSDLIAACRDRVSAMSLSPETPGILPVIRALRERGIAVFLTHTAASVEDTRAAIEAGARHATHFYDVFGSPPEHDAGVRPVGVVETVLAHPGVSVDFIADGVHVHPEAIRAALCAKSSSGVALITDSNVGAGLPPGRYDTPWGFPVDIGPQGGARHATEGFLAGSSLTMNRGMANLTSWLDLPEEEIWAMGTITPSSIAGLESAGDLRVGSSADIVLWGEHFEPDQTWLRGISVYDKQLA